VALTVAAYRAGDELLSGVELTQVALNPGGHEIGSRALERIAGLPLLTRLGKAPGGLIDATHAGVGGSGSPSQPRGEGRYT
jgi:hypothetical protein